MAGRKLVSFTCVGREGTGRESTHHVGSLVLGDLGRAIVGGLQLFGVSRKERRRLLLWGVWTSWSLCCRDASQWSGWDWCMVTSRTWLIRGRRSLKPPPRNVMDVRYPPATLDWDWEGDDKNSSTVEVGVTWNWPGCLGSGLARGPSG